MQLVSSVVWALHMPHLQIDERVRHHVRSHWGVIFDAHCNIVSSFTSRGLWENNFEVFPLMLRLDGGNGELQLSLWRLDYPVRSAFRRQWVCNDSGNPIGESVCCEKGSPLGRAIVRLQRRIRFRKVARRTLKRILSCHFCEAVNARIVDTSLAPVTLYPHVK